MICFDIHLRNSLAPAVLPASQKPLIRLTKHDYWLYARSKKTYQYKLKFIQSWRRRSPEYYSEHCPSCVHRDTALTRWNHPNKSRAFDKLSELDYSLRTNRWFLKPITIMSRHKIYYESSFARGDHVMLPLIFEAENFPRSIAQHMLCMYFYDCLTIPWTLLNRSDDIHDCIRS